MFRLSLVKKIYLIEKRLSVIYSDVRDPWWPLDFRLSEHVSQNVIAIMSAAIISYLPKHKAKDQ